jgi:transposase
VTAYPGLTGRRLLRELRERGYEGGYTAVTDVLREIRPGPLQAFEVRFETPPGDQAQVDFAPRVVHICAIRLAGGRIDLATSRP